MIETEIKVYAQSALGYFVSYRDPFTKRTVKKRIGDRREAENYREQLLREFNTKMAENPGEMLVQDLMKIHLRDNPDTYLFRQKSLITDFLDTFGTLQIKEVTTDMVRSWLDRLRIDRNHKATSIYGARVNINFFFRDLVRLKVIPVSPVSGVFYERRPLEAMRKPIVLSEAQLDDLLVKAKEYSPGVFYPLFRTFVETGAKSSEMMELKWDAVNFKAGTITFPGDKTLLKRTIPISEELRDALAKKRPVLDYVFTSLYDEKMTQRKTSAYINEFKARYGIEEKWMYFDLRHSFAHNWIANCGDPKKLKENLGIRSSQTFRTVYSERPIIRVGPQSLYET